MVVKACLKLSRFIDLPADVGHDAEAHDDIPTDPMVKLFESGKAKIVGGELAELKRFLSYFDKLNKEPVPIATK